MHSMSSPPAVLTQPRPRFRTAPEAVASDAQRAIDLAAAANLHLYDWQQDVVRDVLGLRPDGKWAARVAALVCPRQNGKGGVLEALELFWLFLCPDKLIVHTAHRFDVSQEHFLRVRALVENTPWLMKRVKSIRTANGSEGIILKDGSRLLFKARSKGSLRGPSPDKIVLDEAYYLWDEALAGILPSQGATPNPQTIYTSSSPIPGNESDVLRRLCRRGREGDVGLAYTEFSCPPDADLDDVANWYAANPSLGSLLTEESLRSDRLSMTDEAFAAEHLGIWHEHTDTPGAIDMNAWNAGAVTADLRGDDWMEPGFAMGLELNADRTWATVGAVGKHPDGGVSLEIAAHNPGTDWVVDWAVESDARNNPKCWVIDPKSQAATFIEPLRDAGLTVKVCGMEGRALFMATAGLYDDIHQGRAFHRDDPLLNAAAKGSTKRIYGDAWLWDRRPGVTITPLVAVTLGWFGLMDAEAAAPAPFVFYT